MRQDVRRRVCIRRSAEVGANKAVRSGENQPYKQALELIEKAVPAGRLISRLSGIGCVVARAWMIARAL